MKLAIADPPYPPEFGERFDTADGSPRITVRSRARRYYGDGTRSKDQLPADFHAAAGEWDDPARHRALLEELVDTYDGWAIATLPDCVNHYAPLPISAELMFWNNPRAQPTSSRVWRTTELVIVYPPVGRRARRTDLMPHQVRDLLVTAQPNARDAKFAGAKPPAWTRWVLDALSYDPETDTVDDLFPGSGYVTNEIAQEVLPMPS